MNENIGAVENDAPEGLEVEHLTDGEIEQVCPDGTPALAQEDSAA